MVPIYVDVKLSAPELKKVRSSLQYCGTVTIFYGSASDFWQVPVPAMAPYRILTIKNTVFKNNFVKNLAFYIVSFSTRKFWSV